MSRKAFTLIELLIVVAILAVLAAVAVPNYLRAELRSRVSQCTADMRSIAHALEAYKTDRQQYPMDFQFYQLGNGGGVTSPFAFNCLGRLTTPVPYLTALPLSSFAHKPGNWFDGSPQSFGYKADLSWRAFVLPYMQGIPDADLCSHWALVSPGPDETTNWGEYMMFGESILNTIAGGVGGGPGCLYDPTNGTVSAGDIVRTGP